jgi:hypothetical protein
VATIGLWAETAVSRVSWTFPPVGDRGGQVRDTLKRPTVPNDVLPNGCRLTPKSLFDSNPAIVTDAKALELIYGFVYVAFRAPQLGGRLRRGPGPGTSKEEFERLIKDGSAAVESGYAAFYQEEGGSPEIGVYALSFKKPLAESVAQQFRAPQGDGGPSALRIAKDSVAVFAWSDGRPDAPDRGCWDVIRRHLEQLDVK